MSWDTFVRLFAERHGLTIKRSRHLLDAAFAELALRTMADGRFAVPGFGPPAHAQGAPRALPCRRCRFPQVEAIRRLFNVTNKAEKMRIEREEALRDARSHIDKGTGLSDEAVERICRTLIAMLTHDMPARPRPAPTSRPSSGVSR